LYRIIQSAYSFSRGASSFCHFGRANHSANACTSAHSLSLCRSLLGFNSHALLFFNRLCLGYCRHTSIGNAS
jgi:hypothetical protein